MVDDTAGWATGSRDEGDEVVQAEDEGGNCGEADDDVVEEVA